jgi:hypothetical protein
VSEVKASKSSSSSSSTGGPKVLNGYCRSGGRLRELEEWGREWDACRTNCHTNGALSLISHMHP